MKFFLIIDSDNNNSIRRLIIDHFRAIQSSRIGEVSKALPPGAGNDLGFLPLYYETRNLLRMKRTGLHSEINNNADMIEHFVRYNVLVCIKHNIDLFRKNLHNASPDVVNFMLFSVDTFPTTSVRMQLKCTFTINNLINEI